MMHMSLTSLDRAHSWKVKLASECHIVAFIPLNGLAVTTHLPVGTGEASTSGFLPLYRC